MIYLEVDKDFSYAVWSKSVHTHGIKSQTTKVLEEIVQMLQSAGVWTMALRHDTLHMCNE